ncbi:hypothetical protein SeLEV6574_g08580 [Synchytrium endobioticum]|uniref:Uncharacterized protein n=1 Tax=Synchytrium endobioticum TaxID=286115 RepID=A0A507BV59_9FUNG|nr:hypothetical protein SeLEV6574_g08580 [Synchytrium endobioticum]
MATFPEAYAEVAIRLSAFATFIKKHDRKRMDYEKQLAEGTADGGERVMESAVNAELALRTWCPPHERSSPPAMYGENEPGLSSSSNLYYGDSSTTMPASCHRVQPVTLDLLKEMEIRVERREIDSVDMADTTADAAAELSLGLGYTDSLRGAALARSPCYDSRFIDRAGINSNRGSHKRERDFSPHTTSSDNSVEDSQNHTGRKIGRGHLPQ